MPFLRKIRYAAFKFNRFLEKFMPATTPFSIVLGFLLPSVFSVLKPCVPLLFGLMTFSGALKLRAAELGKSFRSPLPILLFFAAAHVIMPVLAMFVSSAFFANNDVITGFVLLFSGPTAVSGFIWIIILKGDMALCLTLILLDTILAPIVVPGSISLLMGAKTIMDMTGIALSLLFMVVIPTIIGVTVNETSKGKIPAAICPFFDPFAKICLMLVIAANAAIVAPGIKLTNPLVWQVALLVIVLTSAGFLLVKLITVMGKCRNPKDITLIISGGLRNNSAVMTIAVAFFPEAAVLPTLMSIICQQTIAAIMGKIFAQKQTADSETKAL
jgi:tagaturonate reductase